MKKRKWHVAPPSTTRLCMVCEEWTKFKYNRNTLHSECSKCGSRSAVNSIKNLEKLCDKRIIKPETYIKLKKLLLKGEP